MGHLCVQNIVCLEAMLSSRQLSEVPTVFFYGILMLKGVCIVLHACYGAVEVQLFCLVVLTHRGHNSTTGCKKVRNPTSSNGELVWQYTVVNDSVVLQNELIAFLHKRVEFSEV